MFGTGVGLSHFWRRQHGRETWEWWSCVTSKTDEGKKKGWAEEGWGVGGGGGGG